MGVPAFFRWLSRKYPSIVVHCYEEKPKQNEDGSEISVDITKPNPNGVEFDNLYLDMNGIIHPCTHPENKPAPKNEDEMMVDIFRFIDRLMAICRPRKLLYMAVDGVAPRAKMNQQRSRRFRAAKDSLEKQDVIKEVKEKILQSGNIVLEKNESSERFDSNCITPGTEFMVRLSECLKFYIALRQSTNPGWKNLKVILSDGSVPGEGEHKIMDYIRRQRAQPDHDPNTHHCLCGADADLIMLGLATHEPHFTIIREEFKPNQPRSCELCGQAGHELKECLGIQRAKKERLDDDSYESNVFKGTEESFIFIRLSILREYLERELIIMNHLVTFEQDLERCIDDWVFLCFFVGNDFLPHLPSLEIREGAIDRLITLYKNMVNEIGGYLTENGIPNMSKVQKILSGIGKVEDEIFKNRRQNELEMRRRQREKMHRSLPNSLDQSFNSNDAFALKRSYSFTENKETDVEDDDENDEVRLWEEGWRSRYYEAKFGITADEIKNFSKTVAFHYTRGLSWVLQYYYQGVPAWDWYFPYHYAPFASDFTSISDVPNAFDRSSKPFRPLEQLMAVFPAESGKFLPPAWRDLMINPKSPIIDFYPKSFLIDLNGKKYAWQGVALLPFVNEKRLFDAIAAVEDSLTEMEKLRNKKGNEYLFCHKSSKIYEFCKELDDCFVPLNTRLTDGMGGSVSRSDYPSDYVKSPLPSYYDDIKSLNSICVFYKNPEYPVDYVFKATLLPNVKMPMATLKPIGYNDTHPNEQYRPVIGFNRRASFSAGSNQTATRFIRASLASHNDHRHHGQSNNFYESRNFIKNAQTYYQQHYHQRSLMSHRSEFLDFPRHNGSHSNFVPQRPLLNNPFLNRFPPHRFQNDPHNKRYRPY